MTRETKYLFLAITTNLLVAFLIFYVIVDFSLSEITNFIADFLLNLLVGISGFYLTGYYIGNVLAKCKRIRISYGFLSAFLILFIGTVAGSTVGFIQEGLPAPAQHHYSLIENITDYYFKPLFWVYFFGFIPTLVLGIVLGLYLERKPGSKELNYDRE